ERIETGLPGEQRVRTLADRDLAFDRVGLALLVKRHHDDRGAVAVDRPRLAEEILFAFLEADRVDDPLTLDALETRLEDRPLRSVHHDRQARNLGDRKSTRLNSSHL